jgi:serine/threonine-protein kinase
MSEAQQRYRVIERLAAGGMAEVYIAESEGIEGFRKQVAIKRVLPHLTEKKRFIAMFLDEARLSANLSHSNVAQVFDIGVGDNAYFIVMEYVDGSDLKVLIESLKQLDKKFSVEAAVYIAAKICEGLSYAHELTNADGVPLRIVHRDMSPPNVLITKYGEIKIVDFGLAKATSQLEKSEAGIIKGKFSYLSPEAALGEDVDHRTDIFAVGIILWEMLAGRRLFFGETDFQTVKLVQQAKVPPLSVENPEVSKELDRILQKALARDPNRRYASARELGLELTGFLFNQAKPVSSYDIADLVRAAMKHRKRVKPDKAVTIDRLIEEALLEFKSLTQDDKAPTASRLSSAPKTTGFEDISHWADEIAQPSQQTDDAMKKAMAKAAEKEPEKEPVRESPPKEEPPPAAKSERKVGSTTLPSLQHAIKAAEEKIPASKKKAPESTGKVEKAAKSTRPAKPVKVEEPEEKETSSKLVKTSSGEMDRPSSASPSANAVRALLLVAALAVIAAGAWFGGLIPH